MNKKLFEKKYIKKLCNQYDLISPQEWGQHFLIDKQVVEAILEASKLNQKDEVIEIGPGFGTLTFALADKVNQVTAFEIEKRLQEYWKQHETENINIIWGDGLQEFKNKQDKLPESYKFIANLPYQITSKVFETVLEAKKPPTSMTVMVQKEVAERICAVEDKSKLSVAVRLFGDPKLVDIVPRKSFYPIPQVDSAILTVKNITSPDINKENFFEVVSAGFAHRRKQLKNNLAVELGVNKDKAGKLLKQIAGNKKIRAQKLSVEEWRQLCNRLEEAGLL